MSNCTIIFYLDKTVYRLTLTMVYKDISLYHIFGIQVALCNTKRKKINLGCIQITT